jgi:hypothetical protein
VQGERVEGTMKKLLALVSIAALAGAALVGVAVSTAGAAFDVNGHEGFETSGLSTFDGWTASQGSLWNPEHSTGGDSTCGSRIPHTPEGNAFAYYGHPPLLRDGGLRPSQSGPGPDCNYSTDGSNAGTLTSDSSVFVDPGNPVLTYSSYSETQNGAPVFQQASVQEGAVDVRQVLVAVDVEGQPIGVSNNYVVVDDLQGSQESVWTTRQVNLGAFAGKFVYVRFKFDTVNPFNNNYFGWGVDNISFGRGSAGGVSVHANPDAAIEGGPDGALVFDRTGDTSQAITVGYAVGGTAVSGDDYAPLGSAFFPAGVSSVAVPVHALPDPGIDANETVIATVTPGDGYAVGTPDHATVTIREKPACDNPPPSSYPDRETFGVHTTSIDCITAYGMAEGFPDGNYRSSIPVTRPQMASFVARLLVQVGIVLPTSPPDAFTGDDAGTPHELSINQLATLGIWDGTTGEQGSAYGVTQPMRRDDMAQLLVNAYRVIAGAPLPEGPDAFTDDTAGGNPHGAGTDNEAAINALANAGVVQGIGGGLYDPTGSVTRGQMASFLARYLQVLVDGGFLDSLA